MFPHISHDNELFVVALVFAFIFGLVWWWNKSAGRWLRKTGSLESRPSSLDRIAVGRPTKPTVLKYSEQEFQGMVSEALDELPEEFDKEWDNVAVIVSTESPTEEDRRRMSVPDGHLLLGSYTGHPRSKGFQAESSSTHNIVVYQPALELLCGDNKERLRHEIRKVVLHELAHHLGMSHERMKKIGLC